MPTNVVSVSVLSDHDLVYQGLEAILTRGGTGLEVTRCDGAFIADADVVLYDATRITTHGLAKLDRLLSGAAPVLVLVWDANRDPRLDAVLGDRDVELIAISSRAEEIASAVLAAAEGPRGTRGQVSADYGLSARELQIIRLIARGRSNQEIANELFLSINSIKTYIRSGYRKLGISRRSQAVVWAAKRGFLVEQFSDSAAGQHGGFYAVDSSQRERLDQAVTQLRIG